MMNNTYRQLDRVLKEGYLQETTQLTSFLEHLVTPSTTDGPANLFLEHNIVSVQNGVEIYSLDPQLLQEFSFRFKVPKINFDKIRNAFTGSMKKMEAWLKKQGVDIVKIKGYVKRIVSKLLTILRGVKSKDEAKLASQKIQKVLVSEVEKAKEMGFFRALAESVKIFVLVVIVNSIVAGITIAICTMLTGPAIGGQLGMAITAIIVAPFTEEIAKNAALKQDFPWLYVTFFAWAELLMYVAAGVPFVIRLLPLAMHYGTVWVQKYMRDRAIDRDEDVDEANSTGLKLGIVIHSLWNTLAVLSKVIVG
jgi:hypothetical protein